jgi:hypothetical protein
MQYIGIHFGCLSIRIFKFVVLDEGSQGSEIKFQSPFGFEALYTRFQGTFPNAYDPVTKAVGYKAIKQVGLMSMKRFDKKFFQGLSYDSETSDTHLLIWRNFIKEVFKNYKVGEYCDPIKIAIFLEDIDFNIQRNKVMPWMGSDDYSGYVFNLLNEEWRNFRQDDLVFFSQNDKAEILRSYIESNFQIIHNGLVVIIGNLNSSVFTYNNDNPKVILSCGPGVYQLFNKCLNFEEQEILKIIYSSNKERIELSKICMKNLQFWKNDILSQMNINLTNIINYGQSNPVWIGGEGANLFNNIGNTLHLGSYKFCTLPDPLLVFASGAVLYQAQNDISKEKE